MPRIEKENVGVAGGWGVGSLLGCTEIVWGGGALAPPSPTKGSFKFSLLYHH